MWSQTSVQSASWTRSVVEDAMDRAGPDQDDLGVQRLGHRLVEPAGVDLGRAGVQPFGDDDIVVSGDRLPAVDHLFEDGIDASGRQQLLDLIGRHRLGRSQRR